MTRLDAAFVTHCGEIEGRPAAATVRAILNAGVIDDLDQGTIACAHAVSRFCLLSDGTIDSLAMIGHMCGVLVLSGHLIRKDEVCFGLALAPLSIASFGTRLGGSWLEHSAQVLLWAIETRDAQPELNEVDDFVFLDLALRSVLISVCAAYSHSVLQRFELVTHRLVGSSMTRISADLYAHALWTEFIERNRESCDDCGRHATSIASSLHTFSSNEVELLQRARKQLGSPK